MLQQLAINWNVDPAIFHLGGFELRYYSLLFVGGFILGYYIMRSFFLREGLRDEKLLDAYLYTLLIGTIVGARLGHCLFYQPDYYLTSWQGFLEIFQPWKGGLASHGGAIALIIAVIWYSRRYGRANNFDFWWAMDRLVIPVCFAGAMIRLGNLFNSEIYGDVTNLPWGIVFLRNGETLPKHPTQLYEAISYIILGACLLWAYWNNEKLPWMKRGFVFGIFLVVLFGMRFLIEFIKEPQVAFENDMVLNMGQLLSIPFVVAGIVIMIYSFIRGKSFLREDPQNKKSARK